MLSMAQVARRFYSDQVTKLTCTEQYQSTGHVKLSSVNCWITAFRKDFYCEPNFELRGRILPPSSSVGVRGFSELAWFYIFVWIRYKKA